VILCILLRSQIFRGNTANEPVTTDRLTVLMEFYFICQVGMLRHMLARPYKTS